MRLKAAFEGKLQEYMKAEFATAERAVTLGVREATDGLKLSMRRQVTSAGLGQRMANTWRGDLYPRGQNSIRAAGMVRTDGILPAWIAVSYTHLTLPTSRLV